VLQSSMFNSSIDESIGVKIKQLPEVAAVAPLVFNLIDLTPDVNALVYGWPADSYELDSLNFTSGKRFRASQPEVVLGDLLAQNLNKKTGDTLTILGETFTITGIFHGGTALETGAVIMPLDQMQNISSRQGKVTAFHVRLRPVPAGETYDQYVAKVQKEIEALVPGIRAEAAASRASNNQIVDMAHSVAWGTSSIALLIGIVGIANTMAMSVFERTREIGVLRALGWKGQHVILLILTEAGVLGLAGGFLGILVGLGALWILSIMPQTASVVSMSVSPVHLVESLLIAVGSGLLAGAYPAWRASRLSPVEALRYE
jgi:putative ABC transport system permease protein